MEVSASEFDRSPLSDTAPEPIHLTRLECLGGVIVSPVKTFKYLSAKPQWLFPLIVVVLWVFLSFVLRMSLISAMTFQRVFQEAGSEPGRNAPGIFFSVFFGLIEWIIILVGAAVVFLAMAGALYVIARAFKAKPSFFALAAALAYAEFVPRLARTSVKGLVPLLIGKFDFYSEKFPTGAAEIFGEAGFPHLLEPLLARIELFHIWSFVLVAILLQFVAGVSRKRAVAMTAVYWAVCILAVTGAFFVSEWVRDAMLPY